MGSGGHQAQLLPNGLADSSVFPHDFRRGGLLSDRVGVLLLTGKALLLNRSWCQVDHEVSLVFVSLQLQIHHFLLSRRPPT